LAAAVLARHGGEPRGPLEADRLLAQHAKGLQGIARAAAEIQYAERWGTTNVPQERLDVLLHVVVAGALPELGGALVVVLERLPGDERQVFEHLRHRDPSIPWGEVTCAPTGGKWPQAAGHPVQSISP